MSYTLWALLLVGTVAIWRAARVLKGEALANAFPSGQPHGSRRYWRLNRAHLNCVENLPIFAAVVLSGHLIGMTEPMFGVFSLVILAGRIAQSVIHVASGSPHAVQARFTAYLVQWACMLAMTWMVVRAL